MFIIKGWGNALNKLYNTFSFGWESKLGQGISDRDYEKSEL